MPRPIYAINLKTGVAQRYQSAREASGVLLISEPSISQIINRKQKKTQSVDGTWYTFCRGGYIDEEQLYEQVRWSKTTPAITKRQRLQRNKELLLTFVEDDELLEFLRRYQEDPSIIANI